MTDALADLDLPEPRADSLAAVAAARDYVHAHPGATREELTDALTPETDHRIGLAAAQALGLLSDPDGYRDWWWEHVVEPGLDAHPNVERVGDQWYPAR